MAQTLLSSILTNVGAKVNQDTSALAGSELLVTVNYADQAQTDWADTYDWPLLRKTQSVTVLLSMTSIGLPNNFRKLLSPVIDRSLTASNTYVEVKPEERFDKLSTDRYCYIQGDDVTGRYMVINPGLPSGASIIFDYKSFPSSLATSSDAVTCPSPRFMTERIAFYILEARSDQRFPVVEARSNQILEGLVEEVNTPSGGENNRTQDWARKTNFRVGRD
jgi:hypothetical protein